jgi:ankyrin repeat protein
MLGTAMTIFVILEKSPHINISKEDGTTPLLLAIEVSHGDIFKLLRHKGQDRNK